MTVLPQRHILLALRQYKCSGRLQQTSVNLPGTKHDCGGADERICRRRGSLMLSTRLVGSTALFCISHG